MGCEGLSLMTADLMLALSRNIGATAAEAAGAFVGKSAGDMAGKALSSGWQQPNNEVESWGGNNLRDKR